MSERDLIFSMLKASGSTELFHRKNHPKWKLPNGRLFVFASTPSDVASYSNALSMLRRELKPTHPQIAEYGRSLPKNKRITNSIGENLASKDIHLFDAIPATYEVEAEVLDVDPDLQPEPVTTYRMPRVVREPKPKPGPAKTLSPEQLAEANRILHLHGPAEMDTYIKACHDDLVEVSPTLTAERFLRETFMDPKNRVAPRHEVSEEELMADFLERARAELAKTNLRLEGYAARIDALRKEEDTDVMRATQLEQYITKHEQLAAEAAQLLAEILPPEPPAPRAPAREVQTKPAHTGPVTKGFQSLPYKIDLIREKVYPILRSKGLYEFSVTDTLVACGEAGIKPMIERPQMQSWLFSERVRGNIAKGGPGNFRFLDAPEEPQPEPVQDEADAAHQ